LRTSPNYPGPKAEDGYEYVLNAEVEGAGADGEGAGAGGEGAGGGSEGTGGGSKVDKRSGPQPSTETPEAALWHALHNGCLVESLRWHIVQRELRWHIV